VLTAAVLHDLIPLSDPSFRFPSEEFAASYRARVGLLADLDLLACVSAYTARTASRLFGSLGTTATRESRSRLIVFSQRRGSLEVERFVAACYGDCASAVSA